MFLFLFSSTIDVVVAIPNNQKSDDTSTQDTATELSDEVQERDRIIYRRG